MWLKRALCAVVLALSSIAPVAAGPAEDAIGAIASGD